VGKAKCGARARKGTCPGGPKGRHVCNEGSLRAGRPAHVQHKCKHCGGEFT